MMINNPYEKGYRVINNTQRKGNTVKSNNVKNEIENLIKEAKIMSNGKNYLDSKVAMHDFAKIIRDNREKSSYRIMEIWAENVKAKGVVGDSILPARLEEILNGSWKNCDGVLSTFRLVGRNSFPVYAFDDTNDNGFGLGTERRRDLRTLTTREKVTIDMWDLLDDQTGEILESRVEDLVGLVYHKIEVTAVLGANLTASNGNDSGGCLFDGGRGLFSMAADISNSSNNGDFSSIVAKSVANATTDDMYRKVIKTVGQVNGRGRGKVAIVPTGFESELRLAKDNDGRYLFQPGIDVCRALGIDRFYEMDEIVGSGYDVIVYALGSYMLIGGDAMISVVNNANPNYNNLLLGKPVAGSLTGYHVAAGYLSSNK